MEEQTITVEEQKLHDEMEREAMILTINELETERDSLRARVNALEVERDKLRENLAPLPYEIAERLPEIGGEFGKLAAMCKSQVAAFIEKMLTTK